MVNHEMYKTLNFITFANLGSWDVKSFNINSQKFNFKTIELKEVLSKTEIQWVEISDSMEYPILGVRSHGQGVYINRIAKGHELTMRRYQRSKENTLFFCKVRTVGGQWGIVYPKFADSYASSNMTYLNIDVTKIMPSYLELLLKVHKLTDEWDKNSIGADGRHFTLSTMLNFQIPLPTLDEQKQLVEKYQAKIDCANDCEKQALELEQSIETYLYDELVINNDNTIKEIKSVLLQFINASNLESWSVQHLINSKFGFLSSNRFNNVRLKEIVLINPTTSFTKIDPELDVSFIPMENISDEYLGVIKHNAGRVNQSKGYTKFIEGDLIWARITPCMQNGKSAIVTSLINNLGYGSTEYHVIRKINDEVNLVYLLHIMQLPSVLKHAMKYFRGSAGQQRVPKEFLEDFSIPLPSIEIQNEIAGHITSIKNQIKELKLLAEQNRSNAILDFEKAIFCHENH